MARLFFSTAIGAPLAAAVLFAPVQAQTRPGSADPSIQDIVVTARKRAESLQDVPASIQVVGATQIRALNASSLSDLNGSTPNASVSPTSGGITIRGISSATRNAGFEAGAALYVDGVYQGRPLGNNQDLIDIDRVEILRGPQGTLYGKNTTAGAFSLTTVSPGETWRGKGLLRLGSRDAVQAQAYVAGPVVSDLLGIKVSGFRRSQDGFQQDVATGLKYGNIDVIGGRGELRFTPGGWTISLRGDYTKDKSRSARPEPVSSAAVIPGMDTIASNIKQPRIVKTGGGSLTIDRGTDVGRITSITALRRLTDDFTFDDDYYVNAPVFGSVSHHWHDKARQLSQEIRLVSEKSGPLSYVVGLYYFDQTLNSNRPFDVGAAQSVFFDLVEIGTKSYAAFANADYQITSKLTLTAGLRYTIEKKDLDFQQKGFAPLGYPTIPRSFDGFTDRDLSPMASIRYQFNPNFMTYVTVSRGFKAGGWNPDITKETTTSGIQFAAEKVTNYEAGIKTQFFDRKLTLNVSGYHMDYSNLQVSQFLGTTVGFVITNAGKAVINGTEIEVIARPKSWLNLRGGGAYNDAHYTAFLSGNGADYAGQQFTNVPKYSAYISGEITAPLTSWANLQIHGDFRYQSKAFFDDARTVSIVGPYASDGYGIVNGNIGLKMSNGFEVSAYAQNLTNKRVLLARAADLLNLKVISDTYGAPREFGVRLGYSF